MTYYALKVKIFELEIADFFYIKYQNTKTAWIFPTVIARKAIYI